ncbi:MAG TPA: hypothetical protein VMF59_09565 [Bacteroidota bacterium]|nr:hypothetical protein [Bacteroidota bacterium]
MKTRFLALVVVAVLPLMAFNCITDSFTIALNLKPFNGTYPITAGNNPNYSGFFTVNPDTMYDIGSYTLDGASVYDVRIATSGPNLGTCAGTVSVNNTLLLTYNGPWTAFNTPQSLLTSQYIRRNQPGIDVLVNAVTKGSLITFTVQGSVTTTPVPAGCSLICSAYVQAYAHKR